MMKNIKIRNFALKTFFEVLLVFFSAIVLLPVWMVVANSLKETRYANLFGIDFPAVPVFENYYYAFVEGKLLRGFFNGMLLAVVSVFIIVLCASMASFVIVRRSCALTKFMYLFFVAGLIVPGALIPIYWILRSLHLLDTYAGLILIYVSGNMAFSVFLYSGFIQTVPKDMDEAAMIDGAGHLRLFFSIVMPLLKPVTITVVMFNFLSVWNDVMVQLFFANPNKWTMPMSVYQFFYRYTQEWNLVFADIVLTVIPVITLYAFAQKYVISGMTSGAVKS